MPNVPTGIRLRAISSLLRDMSLLHQWWRWMTSKGHTVGTMIVWRVEPSRDHERRDGVSLHPSHVQSAADRQRLHCCGCLQREWMNRTRRVVVVAAVDDASGAGEISER